MIYEQLNALIAQNRPCALATLVAVSGSSPQNVGAKVLFLPDGRIIGTIGGGCMEAEAQRIARDCLRTGTPRLFELRLDDDFGWDDGLICGGRVTIFVDPSPERSREAWAAAQETVARRERAALCTYVRAGADLLGRTFLRKEQVPGFGIPDSGRSAETCGSSRLVEVGDGETLYVEPITPRPVLLVCGAGHIGAVLAQVGAMCGFEVVVVDDRPSFANPERLPFADRVVVDDIPRFVRDFPTDEDTYIVIVTRGHRHDAHALRECIHANARYIGMIGSKRKICVIYEEMLREGLATPEELRRVRSPLGLAIGAREVGEIAVSIAAELVAVRRGVDSGTVPAMQYIPPFLRDA